MLTPDMTFEKRKLSDYAGKYLLIFFYPMDFTFVCPSEIITFADAAKTFRERYNCEVLIGSCDSVYSHYAWCLQPRAEGGIGNCGCDLFSDKTYKMARDYGCLIDEAGVALRAMYIVSDKGVLRHVTINDLPVGRSLEEASRLVQAFQYADKTGNVVPCGWTPEKPDDVIVPDMEKMKGYFKKHF